MNASPATGDSRSTAHRSRVTFSRGEIQEPPLGSVIAFSGNRETPAVGTSFATTIRRYDFAAVRASNGRWYTTGHTCPPFGYSWERLQKFMLDLDDLEAEVLR